MKNNQKLVSVIIIVVFVFALFSFGVNATLPKRIHTDENRTARFVFSVYVSQPYPDTQTNGKINVTSFYECSLRNLECTPKIRVKYFLDIDTSKADYNTNLVLGKPLIDEKYTVRLWKLNNNNLKTVHHNFWQQRFEYVITSSVSKCDKRVSIDDGALSDKEINDTFTNRTFFSGQQCGNWKQSPDLWDFLDETTFVPSMDSFYLTPDVFYQYPYMPGVCQVNCPVTGSVSQNFQFTKKIIDDSIFGTVRKQLNIRTPTAQSAECPLPLSNSQLNKGVVESRGNPNVTVTCVLFKNTMHREKSVFDMTWQAQNVFSNKNLTTSILESKYDEFIILRYSTQVLQSSGVTVLYDNDPVDSSKPNITAANFTLFPLDNTNVIKLSDYKVGSGELNANLNNTGVSQSEGLNMMREKQEIILQEEELIRQQLSVADYVLFFLKFIMSLIKLLYYVIIFSVVISFFFLTIPNIFRKI